MAEEKRTVTIHLPNLNLWMIISIVLGIALVLSFTGVIPTGRIVATGGLTASEAASRAIDYINENLVQGSTATLVSVEEVSGIYKVITSYQGSNIPVYITKDGKFLILQQQTFDTTKAVTTTTTQPTEIPKTDKPTAELFVMSFCPYGVQAENLMKPVVDLLGEKADIKVRFITTISGDTVDSVQSLHGTTEAQEDLRQVCIMKNYDQETYWNYLSSIDNDCYGKITTSDATALGACWKEAATDAGIDTSKIETCSEGTEGLNLLKTDEQLAEQYGVTGSPTLIINGVEYSGSRSSEAYKQAICDAFTTAPSECSQTLSETSSTATGGCA